MTQLPSYLQAPVFDWANYVPLLYALILGGAIGIEREWSGRPAGLRTHVLVCVSSTMLIMISQQLGSGSVSESSTRLVFDPNRMAAGIVTGIGFLGAATVLRAGDVLRGLTTAACIWYVAGLGIILGNENYALGIVGTVTVLLVLTVLNPLTSLLHPVIYRRLVIVHGRDEALEVSAEISALLKKERCKVLDLSSSHDAVGHQHELVFYVMLKDGMRSPQVTQLAAAIEGIASARWKRY